MIRTDLGIATAYAEAVSKGYAGTRDEFGQMFADFGKTAEKVTEDKKAVEQMKLSVEETKNSVDTTASEFGQNVADKTAEAKAAITEHANTEKGSATAAISEAKDAATGAITEAQTSAMDAIASAKDSATAEIAKKGTDTLATIPDDYTELTKAVGSLKEDLANKITKFYASNQGETHITDSDDGKIMDMVLFGKSEQAVTTGAQLLGSGGTFIANTGDVSVQTNNPYEVSWTHNTNVSIRGVYLDKVKPILANKKYTISFDARFSDGNSHSMRCTDTNFTCVNGRNSVLIDIREKDSTVSFYTISNIIKGLSVTISNIMVEEGSTAHDFEPYTGGIPSPNPDYPQEIKSVVNPTIKICGKNLFDSKKFPLTLNVAIDTNTGAMYNSLSGKYCATEKYIPFPYSGKKISFNASMSLCAYDKDYKFISTVNKNNGQVPSGTMYVRFDIKAEDKDKAQIELSENTTPYEPYHEQTVTLPYTLNAIPVESGGNVTIDGQQYIADYVDVERGKVVRIVDSSKLDNTQSIINKTEWLLAEQQETDLTTEQTQALKELVTYYPVTNISVTSEQLDGYTVFNYPISMANGWNYIKKQLNDNRDYIYDMDIQSAEAYVNSEYAVALTELEV